MSLLILLPILAHNLEITPAAATCHGPSLAATLQQLENEKPGLARYRKTSDLAVRLVQSGSKCVTQDDVNTLSYLLRDDDRSMVFWAAMMLANIGPRARSAIPELEAALAKNPCEEGTVTAASAIRLALRKLGDNSLLTECGGLPDAPR
jgi:hypothetical protein